MPQEIHSEINWREQAPYLALIGLSSVVLMIARLLPPSPRGVGTHELLGLPPCFFLKLTGFPCPSCGLTTCFAYAAKLHFHAALLTQPFGLLAFFLTVILIPLSGWLIYRRVPWQQVITSRAAKTGTGLLLVLWVLGWIYKIAVMR